MARATNPQPIRPIDTEAAVLSPFRVRCGMGGKPQHPLLVRSISILILAVAAGIASTGCHRQPALTPEQTAGKHLYEVRCAHCHRDNDLGLKKIPPDLHGLFSSSTLPSGAPSTDAQVQQSILAGKGTMPSFAGRFTDQQMAGLLSYLHTNLR